MRKEEQGIVDRLRRRCKKPDGTKRKPSPREIEAADHIERLEAALEPFVAGAGHTMTFLRSREKMHSAGLELYMDDVRRAREAIANLRSRP